jgi:photosystem II Psb27 protein
MKRLLSRLLFLVLVVCVGLMGCTSTPNGSIQLSGNYQQDSLTVVNILRSAIQQPDASPEKGAIQEQAREFSARYRRDGSLTKLISFTTMRTALNSLAAHYSAYPNRPVPQKMKDRLEQEFKQIETAIARGA